MTEVGLIFKSNSETFTLRQDTANVASFIDVHNLTTANVQSVDYNTPHPGSETWTVQIDNDSFIKFTGWQHGLSVQVKGKGNIFSGSEGMFGSWDYGGVRFKNGTLFDTSLGWMSPGAIELALDWQVHVANSLMFAPSAVCDASSTCGPAPAAFQCHDVRRVLEVDECDYTNCDHISPQFLKEACEIDLDLTGDTSFACEPSKLDPIIEIPDSNDFIPHPNDNVGVEDPDEPDPDDPDKPPDGDHGGEDNCPDCHHPCETNCTHTSGCNPGMYLQTYSILHPV